MASFTAGQPLILAGTAEPAAYLELKSIGLPEAKRDSLCAGLTDSVSGFCGIAKDRVFLVMADVSASLWGYDGKTIG
jgi:phenylpyruvate tautomerase